MRRALLLLCLCLPALGCAKPGRAPAEPGPGVELEPDVRELVERKLAAARAAPSDARAHADLGLACEANELWETAAQSFANALALDDSHPVWLYHRALALHGGGQSAAALAALRESARELPREPAVQQRLGQWLLDAGDAPGARAAFASALARRPDQPEFLAGMAGVELAQERWDEALELSERALRAAPGYRPALLARGRALEGLGRDEEARSFLRAGEDAQVLWCADELAREYTAYRLTSSALREEAARALASGSFARAVELLEKLRARTPADASVLCDLAAGLIELGQFARALPLLQQALALAPQSAPVQINLSVLYERQQQLDKARNHAVRAVELDGRSSRAHYQLARILVLQQELEGGYRELQAALQIEERDLGILLALTDSAAKLQKLDEARGWCRRALELDPNCVPARGLQGSLALAAGDFEDVQAALAVLEQVAPQDPRTLALRNELRQAGR